ncbi:MAG: N5-glutamine methyltransferase family protein, partial [Rhizomicrobium sp.]
MTAERLAATGIESAWLDARILRDHAGGNAALYESHISRRLAGEPVAYITGTKGFWTLDLDIGPGALVPRPETETLIEQAIAIFPDRAAPLRVLDLGVGSGAILLAFLSEYPNATGVGVDRATEWATLNAAKLGIGGRAQMLCADWSELPEEIFDAIFSNPPYLTAAEVDTAPPELSHEPRQALDGGPDGLDAYRQLAPLIAARLNLGGYVFL